MSEITLQAIEKLFDDRLEPINTKLTNIESTLNQHTTALDGLAKSVQILLDDKRVSTERIERVEHAIKLLAGKVGLKLDW